MIILLGVFFTYRVSNRIILWLLIILPPFFLSPLALIQITNPIGLFIWLPVLPVILYSVVILLVRTCSAFKNPNNHLTRIKLIRPALTIAVILSVFIYQKVSSIVAFQYAMELAQKIQADCDSNGVCPENMSGWREKEGKSGDPNYYSSHFYKLGLLYDIDYKPSSDRSFFRIEIDNDTSSITFIDGGVNRKLNSGKHRIHRTWPGN